jgi:hypothetical protein
LEKNFGKIAATDAGALATSAGGDYPAGLPQTLFGSCEETVQLAGCGVELRLLL